MKNTEISTVVEGSKDSRAVRKLRKHLKHAQNRQDRRKVRRHLNEMLLEEMADLHQRPTPTEEAEAMVILEEAADAE